MKRPYAAAKATKDRPIAEEGLAARDRVDAAFDRIEGLCRQAGLVLTLQRRLVIEALLASNDHPSAFEVHARVPSRRRMGIATVYRTLNALTDAGIVTRHAFSEGKARYEIARSVPHPHLIDVATGAIVELDNRGLAPLVEKVARRLGYRLVDFRLKLFASSLAGQPG